MEEIFLPKKIKNHFSGLTSKINKDLNKDLSIDMLILKSHLIVEHYLNELLIANIDSIYKKIQKNDLGFAGKVKALEGKKIINESEKIALLELNRVRNEYSHNIDYKLSISDLDRLGYSVHKLGLNKFNYLKEKYKNKHMQKKHILREVLKMMIIIPVLKAIDFLIED